ncbi:MAG: efflux RND transporter periplasmic adaptor subunit [Candidatus Paceibacterota bacterium]|jgi:multidrug efflux pump subunit AcrA (membrane-fusion protein)
MNFFNKIFGFLNRKKYIYGIIAFLLIVAVILIFNDKKAVDQTFAVKHTDFINKVSISGKVVATEDVDLSFKSGGRIGSIFFSVGQGAKKEQMIRVGTLIAKIDTKNAEKVVHDAEIDLESAKLSLAKIKIQNSDEEMNADLVKAYDDGFTAVSDSFLDLSTIVTGLDDILNEENVSDNTARASGQIALNYKNESEKLFYQARSSLENSRKKFRLLNRSSSRVEIESIINGTYETAKIFSNAVKSAKNLVDYLSDDTSRTTEYASSKDTLAEYTDDISGHLGSLLSVQTSIKNSKDAFPSASLDIQDALLSIKQKENSVQDAKNKLSDCYIRAPFDGVITKIDAKVGEIATADVPLITMMSVDNFQIESYVPEVNIAQIKLGDEAVSTLDAYGEDVLFNAKIVSIDPAETIRDGVSTYKIKLQFSEKDDRIKSGMTANVSITTFNKLNVIVIPGGVIFEKGGKKFVQVKIGEEISDREVFLGSISSLGQTEIVSGLADGDLVILNPPNSLSLVE